MNRSMFYFGCVDEPGHYFWNDEGKQLYLREPKDLGMPWNWFEVDGGLLPQRKEQGFGLFHAKKNWVALSIHDFTVDTRPNSHSTFFVQNAYKNVGLVLEELRIHPFFFKILDRIGEMHIILIEE